MPKSQQKSRLSQILFPSFNTLFCPSHPFYDVGPHSPEDEIIDSILVEEFLAFLESRGLDAEKFSKLSEKKHEQLGKEFREGV